MRNLSILFALCLISACNSGISNNNDKVLFDPISVVYSLRNKNLITGDKHEYNILGIDERESNGSNGTPESEELLQLPSDRDQPSP